jgi:collagen type IV alpha-3-binding protein
LNFYFNKFIIPATLDSTKIIEVLDPETVIFFQLHKRVWPAAQRDSCFWSHIRCISKSEEDQPTWLVINYTTPHALAPVRRERKKYFFSNVIYF